MPNSVESQPWVPSSQACRVGLSVGAAVGAEVVGASVGAGEADVTYLAARNAHADRPPATQEGEAKVGLSSPT